MAAERSAAKRIAIFNHKGGVGKTTLTLNIAYALSSLRKRVLLVDSDPQCNLTSYSIEDQVVDDLLDNSDGPAGRTVWSALKPIVEASGDVNVIEPFELPNGRIWLVPGDIRLSEFEVELTDFWNQSFQRKVRGIRGTTALSALVNELSDNLKADFVFYDIGPNIGALNRAVLLDCDYFIVAAAADLFSVRALKMVGRTIAEWVKDWQTILDLAPSGLYVMPGLPRFLGYIPQRFRMYALQPARTHSRYFSAIERRMRTEVAAVLREVDSRLAPRAEARKLGEVKDFGTLVATAQKEGRPLWRATGSPEQKSAARTAFREIATTIIRAIN